MKTFSIKKSLLALAFTVAAVMTIALIPKTTAQAAKSPSDLGSISGVSVDGKNVGLAENAVLDGYDLDGYTVYIQGKNATLKNCENIKFIDVQKDASGATISGNTITGSTLLNQAIWVRADGVTVSGNTITGAQMAIGAEEVSDLVISGNTITGCTGSGAIWANGGKNLTVSDNTVKNSAHYAMAIVGTEKATISGNTFDHSGTDATVAPYTEGVKIHECKDVTFTKNTVSYTASVKNEKGEYGNGIVVAYTTNIEISDNTFNSNGNHGVQISFSTTGAVIKGNEIFSSGNDGISVTRGSSADITGNNIHNNIGNGIVYQWVDTDEKAVSGTVSGNTLDKNSDCGIYIDSASVDVKDNTISSSPIGIDYARSAKGTVSGNTLKEVTSYGIRTMNTASVTISGNYLYLTTRNNDATGIANSSSSYVSITSNKIANYGMTGILCWNANHNTNVTIKNNQVSVSDTAAFHDGYYGNAYFIDGKTDSGSNAAILNPEIGETVAKGGTYFEGVEAGVVIGNTRYKATTDKDGKFAVSYNKPMAGAIVLYAYDKYGNAICLNAPVDFDLGGSGADRSMVEAFVTRLYEECLSRTPDEAGLKYWTDMLVNGEKTGTSAAYDFIFSAEFKLSNYCNTCYIEKLYKAFMGREYDAAGLGYWLGEIRNGMTREAVFNEFAKSQEFSNICNSYGIAIGQSVELPKYGTVPKGSCARCGKEDGVTSFVKRLYNVCLDRTAEGAGLDYWREILWTHAQSGTEVAKNFLTSEEFTMHGYDDTQFVKYLYNAYMGREYEQAGLDYWLGQMKNGMTRDEVIASFAASDEFKAICADYGITWK